MKKLLFILLFLTSLVAKGQFVNNNPRIFNVVNYGAKHDDVTDDSKAIQATINVAVAAGGGTIFFPYGTYIINDTLQTNIGGVNYNAQLYWPYQNTFDSTRTAITFLGETPHNMSFSSPLGPTILTSRKGVIIRSTLSTLSASGQSHSGVFGTSTGSLTFNYLDVNFRNISIMVKTNPTGGGPIVGGIACRYCSNVNIDNVAVYNDSTNASTVTPIYDISGIEFPDNGSETFMTANNIFTESFRKGLSIGEHVNGNQLQSICDYYGIYWKKAFHGGFITKYNAFWCRDGMYVFDSTNFNIGTYDLEVDTAAAAGWFKFHDAINDSANAAMASVSYNVVLKGVGRQNGLWTVNGASNVWTGITGLPLVLLPANTTSGLATLTGNKLYIPSWMGGRSQGSQQLLYGTTTNVSSSNLNYTVDTAHTAFLLGGGVYNGSNNISQFVVKGTFPFWTMYRTTSSGGEQIQFDFNNASSAQKTYAALGAQVNSATAGAEQGGLNFFTTNGGALNAVVQVDNIGNTTPIANNTQTLGGSALRWSTVYGTTGNFTNITFNGTAITTSTGTGGFVLSASPTLTGTPLSTTAAAGTNTTQIATTAFVLANVLKYAHTIFIPTTGGTVSLVNNQYNIINPAGALLAVTLNLPSSPANNDVVYIKFTQTVSTVTYANGTVVDGITAPSAGGLVVLTFDSGTTSWY